MDMTFHWVNQGFKASQCTSAWCLHNFLWLLLNSKQQYLKCPFESSKPGEQEWPPSNDSLIFVCFCATSSMIWKVSLCVYDLWWKFPDVVYRRCRSEEHTYFLTVRWVLQYCFGELFGCMTVSAWWLWIVACGHLTNTETLTGRYTKRGRGCANKTLKLGHIFLHIWCKIKWSTNWAEFADSLFAWLECQPVFN